MKKNKNKYDDKEKSFIKKDDDLGKKGKVDLLVEPPWPVQSNRKSNVTKEKTGNEQ